MFGCYLNELADIVADAFLYLPFAQLPEFWPPSVLLFIFLAALAETAGILGALAGASRRYDGPLGKNDRAVLLGLLALVEEKPKPEVDKNKQGFWRGWGSDFRARWPIPMTASTDDRSEEV